MAWTTPRTWASGPLTAAELNTDVRDNETWLKAALTAHGITSDTTPQPLLGARYGASVTVASESVPTATDKAITFDTEVWDDATFWTVAAGTRLTMPLAGTYDFKGWVQFATHDTGQRQLWIEVNGTTSYNKVIVDSATGSTATGLFTACDIALSAGDYVRLMARQNSGAANAVQARFQCRRVSV